MKPSEKTMKLQRELIEAIACEMGGGKHWFYEYPNSEHDRKRYREKAAEYLNVIYDKLREESSDVILEYGMSVILNEDMKA